MIQALPLLLDLDGQRILERWTSEDEDEISVEENDEDLPELIGPFCTERGEPVPRGWQTPAACPDLGASGRVSVIFGVGALSPEQCLGQKRPGHRVIISFPCLL